jgi:diguanylate cyclase (GGDEF)-like protein/PAS domain S-box-containing protein
MFPAERRVDMDRSMRAPLLRRFRGTKTASRGVGAPRDADDTSLFAALRRAPARWPWLAPVALVAGVAASVGTAVWAQLELEREATYAFAKTAHELADQVEWRTCAYGEVVYALRALIDSSGHVTRGEFHRFAQGLAIGQRYPGITNVSHSFRVHGSARAAFETTMRTEAGDLLAGLAPFAIAPAGERAEYVVLSYIEPLKDNAAALGLDLATDAARNDAVVRARDSGTLSATAGMTLLRDAQTRATSVLLRLAVFEGGGVPPTVEARRRAFAGVAGVAIRLPEMLRAALPPAALARARLRIEDVTGNAPGDSAPVGALLFDSAAAGTGQPSPVLFEEYAATSRFDVGDRAWSVRLTPLADPLRQDAEWLLPYAAGVLVSTVALLVYALLRALAAAEVRGASLRRNVHVLEFHRARLAETQEIAAIGGFEWDTREDRQSWSDQLYRLLGRDVGDPAAPDRDFFFSNVVHHQDSPRVRAALRRVLEDRGPVQLQCRIVRPDGAERIVSTVTRLETADDGARTRVVGTVRDVTDEWQAAERERAQLRFIQTMMEAIPIPVFQKDTDGRFSACNDAWCRFVGKPRELVIGARTDDMLPGPHLVAIREQDRRLLAHAGNDSIEIVVPRAGGEPRRVLVHKASYAGPDGKTAGLVGALFDITELKQTRDRLEQTVAELDRRNRLAELLGGFGEVLQASLGIDDAYEAIVKYLPRLAPGSSGLLYRVEAGRGTAVRRASWGDPDGVVDALATSECVAVRRGQPRFVADSARELNCRHFTTPPASYACLPLASHGELLGLVHIQRADAGHPEGCDPATVWPALRTAAEHISLALANLGIRETLREQATRDMLTKLYNRHYLEARLDQEIARAQRGGSPIAAVLLDIDHFKRFNDTFGHAAGDHVLRELGAILLRAGRLSDVPCRYGGEEFLLLLPDASREVARRRAEEVREALRALQLEWEGLPLGTVTVSAGVAVFPDDGADRAALLKSADQALYRAKELGRDRVVVALRATTVGG